MAEFDGKQQNYELIPHTGDLAIRIWGTTLPELFINAASALFSVMTQGVTGEPAERNVDIDGSDKEELLVNWLNELIFLHETENISVVACQVLALTPTHLTAHVTERTTQETLLVIKAATYHNLLIQETDHGVETTVVFDI
jgi:SHS2 domain-containing protein